MGSVKYIEDIIEEKLLYLHTAFLAKVLSTDGKIAKIQPLNMIKQYGEEAKKQAVIEDVPILQSVKKFKEIDCICVTGTAENSLDTEKRKHIKMIPVEVGDIVLCVCSERDITETKKGTISLPVPGHHMIHDAIIAGVL